MQFPLMHKESGMAQWAYDNGEVKRLPTVMCVHCEYHWNVEPGSGHKRGFCQTCMGPLCFRRGCPRGHVDFLKRQIERGLRREQFFVAVGV